MPPSVKASWPTCKAEGVFRAGGVDAQRDHDAVLADMEAVDQQRHQIEGIERGRSPGIELRGGLHDKSATHRTLAGAADADLGADWLQAAPVLPCGDPEEHLLDDATIQRVGIRERLKRR